MPPSKRGVGQSQIVDYWWLGPPVSYFGLWAWEMPVPVRDGDFFHAFVNCFTNVRAFAVFLYFQWPVRSRSTQEGCYEAYSLNLFDFAGERFRQRLSRIFNYVKANSQLKQVSNSQIQCFVTKPFKQHIKLFTFTSGNVTVACTRSGSYGSLALAKMVSRRSPTSALERLIELIQIYEQNPELLKRWTPEQPAAYTGCVHSMYRSLP